MVYTSSKQLDIFEPLQIANDIKDGKSTHVACATNLMPGEYDDVLEWPLWRLKPVHVT